VSTRFQTTLIDTVRCGPDVLMARFERPAGYSYEAGQWLRLTLGTSEGEETRTFTHASAPEDDWLEIATRLSGSSFKVALGALSPGDAVTIVGPGGRLVLPEGTDRVVFLVGGMGVTPARSILRHAVEEGWRFEDAIVFYGNRDPSCVPYGDEFEAMAEVGVRVIEVFEQVPPGSSAEKGLITAGLVRRYLGTPFAGPYVVAGPPLMVGAMVSVLDELGVSPEMRMVEWFGTPKRT
jgi:ferredoxin-NADP reductase